MKEKERWVKLPMLSKYLISSRGRVKSIRYNRTMATNIDRYGYKKIHLRTDTGDNHHTTIHRLVAIGFIENPNQYKQVNHKDGNKLNNNVSNLEWVTARDNVIHSYDNLLNTNTTHLRVLDIKTNEEMFFRSFKSFSRYIGTKLNVVIPLARNSGNNPILGRYIVSVIDEQRCFKTSNTIGRGTRLYCYDHLTGTITQYNSVNHCKYYTGLRELVLVKGKYKRDDLGYSISTKEKCLDKSFVLDRNSILQNRKDYLNKPLYRRAFEYYLYDYSKNEETSFEDVDHMVTYLGTLGIEVSRYAIITALYLNKLSPVNSLVRGFGVMSSKCRLTKSWFPYNNDYIELSRNLKYTNRGYCYLVNIGNKEKIISGYKNLIKFLKRNTKTKFRTGMDIPLNELANSTGIPNLTISIVNEQTS